MNKLKFELWIGEGDQFQVGVTAMVLPPVGTGISLRPFDGSEITCHFKVTGYEMRLGQSGKQEFEDYEDFIVYAEVDEHHASVFEEFKRAVKDGPVSA